MADEFGKALWDICTTGKTKRKLFLRRHDGIWEKRDLTKYFDPYSKFPDFQKKALKHTQGTILDIGVGAGKHSLYLQEKGMNVLGIDTSPYCIKVCKKRGLKRTKLMDLKQMNFGKEKFDTVLIFGSGAALAGSDGGLLNFLRKITKITLKDAVVLIDSTNIKKAKRGIFHYMGKGNFQLRGEVNGKPRAWFTPVFISDNKMRNIVKKSSWKIKKMYKNKTGDQYSGVFSKK